MSYDKSHSRDGRNGRRVPPQKPTAPPRSTLAGLLSSQRRSAAQTDRYRVQSARPFADSSQISQAVGGGKKHPPPPSRPTQGRRWGDVNSSYGRDSRQGSDSSSSFDRSKSSTPCPLGTNCRNPTSCQHMHNSTSKSETNTATAPSRRVRFGPPTSSDSQPQPVKSEQAAIPRKRRSRWGPPTSASVANQSQSHADAAAQNQAQNTNDLPKAEAKSLPVGKSILRKKEERLRATGEKNDSDTQQTSLFAIPKKSSPPREGRAKIRDGKASEVSDTTNAYPKSSDVLKRSHSNDSASGTFQSSRGDSLASSSLRRDDEHADTNIAQTKSKDAPNDLEEGSRLGEDALSMGDDSERIATCKKSDKTTEQHLQVGRAKNEPCSALDLEGSAANAAADPSSGRAGQDTEPKLGAEGKRADDEPNGAEVMSGQRQKPKDAAPSPKLSETDTNSVPSNDANLPREGSELLEQDSSMSNQGESPAPSNGFDSPHSVAKKKKKKKKKKKRREDAAPSPSKSSGMDPDGFDEPSGHDTMIPPLEEGSAPNHDDYTNLSPKRKKKKKKKLIFDDACDGAGASPPKLVQEPELAEEPKAEQNLGEGSGRDDSSKIARKKKKRKIEDLSNDSEVTSLKEVPEAKTEESKPNVEESKIDNIAGAKLNAMENRKDESAPKSKRDESSKSELRQGVEEPKLGRSKAEDKKQKTDDFSLDAGVMPPRPTTMTEPERQDAAETTGCNLSPKKRRKKDFSPFRIKVGCVVAVRFRKLGDGGNSAIVPVVKEGDSYRTLEQSPETALTSKQPDSKDKNGGAPDQSKSATTENDSGQVADASQASTEEAGAKAAPKPNTKRIFKQYEVWSSPIPGRDDGLSLLGSWIRCAFPKSFISKWQKNNENGTKSSLGRFVEGNVISILGDDSCSQRGITVCLLVDRSSLSSLPYLEVMPDDSNDPTLRSSQQKRRKTEAKIRGEDKVAVRVTLASTFDQRNGTKLDPGVVSQWVVRKRVSAKPAGKKPTKKERKKNKQSASSLFVGDGNDTQSQQEQNWRWIASRSACQLMASSEDTSAPENNSQDLVSQLVGEVVKIEVSPTQDDSASLATVTIKRLWTPEQVKGGRLVQHQPLELFASSQDGSNEKYFQSPIESLIVVGKRVTRHVDAWKGTEHDRAVGDDPEWSFSVTHTYQTGINSYLPLCENAIPKESLKSCHYCQRLYHESQLQMCQHNQDSAEILGCDQCLRLMELSPRGDGSKTSNKSIASVIAQNDIDQAFSDLAERLQSEKPLDFMLPDDAGHTCFRPSFLPHSGNKKSKSYSKTTKEEDSKSVSKQKQSKKRRASSDAVKKPRKKQKVKADINVPKEEEDEEALKAGSSRAVAFDKLRKRTWGSSKLKFASDDTKQPAFRQNARPRVIKIGKTEEKTALSGRAARANQRRMFKSLASLGGASTVDRLAGRDREQQLRFDKSQIHGWGVYAEEQINAGDMIIEYRGEIIGNAVADKRELEYEKAKLDDYMFRIDAYTVCDATMLGNVARYINASCSPNCYTQIITAGEDKNKRIVIYAKRDIHRGEELSYDYKFSLEYDPAKRIPCRCGSPECRGFMNWDKKYL